MVEGYASAAAGPLQPGPLLALVADLLVSKQAVKYVSGIRDDRRRRLERMLSLAHEIATSARRAPARTAPWRMLP